MLVAYLDEFGHVGPYICEGHAKFGQHPVFGYAGFVLPAENARAMGSDFVRAKNSLFKTEIERSPVPAQWERKGSEYFTTGSIEKRPEQVRVFKGLIRKLRALDGQVFYYGDEKERGTLKETGRGSAAIMEDSLRQTINRLCRHAANLDQEILILADSFTDKSRQALAAKMYAHIYSRPAPEMKRVIEAPLHIESKLNSGIQFADWLCALVSRASHYQLTSSSEFGWAGQRFQTSMSGAITFESKIHLRYGQDIHHSDLFKQTRVRFDPPVSGTVASRIPNPLEIYEAFGRRGRNPA